MTTPEFQWSTRDKFSGPLERGKRAGRNHLALAFAGQASGRYIDIGAGHPIADNVSFWFYERGWQGIVVEPQPALVALYARLAPSRHRR